MKKRVTTIIVEKERIVEIRWRGSREILCEQCGTEVRLLTAEEAGALGSASPCMSCCCGSRLIELEGGSQ